jgi:hypothetical protein
MLPALCLHGVKREFSTNFSLENDPGDLPQSAGVGPAVGYGAGE